MLKVEQCPACASNDFRSLLKTSAQMHPSKEQFQFDQCNNCQLVFLNPRVPLKQLNEYYTDYYLPYRGPKAWGKYEKQVARSQAKLDQQRVRFVNKQQAINSETIILDIGCGKPSFLLSCYQKFNCRCIGLDFSAEGWRDDPEYQNVLDLRVGEVEQLPETLRPDIITMWHYLEHDYDPLRTLKILKRIAHKKTKLIIEVPNYDSESRKAYKNDWAGFHTPRHTFLFSPNNLKALLIRSGWVSPQVNTFGTLDPYVLYWMSEMERRGIDWSKSMETEFFGYVWGMFRFLPKRINAKKRALGIMTAVAKINE